MKLFRSVSGCIVNIIHVTKTIEGKKGGFGPWRQSDMLLNYSPVNSSPSSAKIQRQSLQLKRRQFVWSRTLGEGLEICGCGILLVHGIFCISGGQSPQSLQAGTDIYTWKIMAWGKSQLQCQVAQDESTPSFHAWFHYCISSTCLVKTDLPEECIENTDDNRLLLFWHLFSLKYLFRCSHSPLGIFYLFSFKIS